MAVEKAVGIPAFTGADEIRQRDKWKEREKMMVQVGKRHLSKAQAVRRSEAEVSGGRDHGLARATLRVQGSFPSGLTVRLSIRLKAHGRSHDGSCHPSVLEGG